MRNPCFGCNPPKRQIGCHGSCQDHKDYIEEEHNRKAIIKAEISGFTDHVDFIKRRKAIRTKRNDKRRGK